MATPSHVEAISKLCRFCGLLLTKDKFSVLHHREAINKAFFIEVEHDIVKCSPITLLLEMFFNHSKHK